MCLSTLYLTTENEKEELMRDVAWMEAQSDGFLVTDLLGKQKFIQARINTIDFVYEHAVVLEKKQRNQEER